VQEEGNKSTRNHNRRNQRGSAGCQSETGRRPALRTAGLSAPQRLVGIEPLLALPYGSGSPRTLQQQAAEAQEKGRQKNRPPAEKTTSSPIQRVRRPHQAKAQAAINSAMYRIRINDFSSTQACGKGSLSP